MALSFKKEEISNEEALDRIANAYKANFIVYLTEDFKSKSSIKLKNPFGNEGKYLQRKIQYSHFKNLTLLNSIKELEDKDIGSFNVAMRCPTSRPSRSAIAPTRRTRPAAKSST